VSVLFTFSMHWHYCVN